MRDRVKGALLALCLGLFACLLLSGAQRLMAGGEDRPPASTVVTVQAYLCGAPADTARADRRDDCRARWESREAQAVRVLPVRAPDSARSDANGNVITSADSYLRTVYQAFALGDGFA